MLRETWQAAGRFQVEAAFGLGVIPASTVLPTLYTGQSITIQEEWLLRAITPASYVPSFVADPKESPFKYRYLQLIYALPGEFPERNLLPPEFGFGQGGESGGAGVSGEWEALPTPPYPVDSFWGYPYPILGDYSWYGVWIAIWNGVPTMHARYGIVPEWLWIITAYPDLEEPYHDAFQEGIYDCFREAIESDGAPWYTPEHRLWISKGINDSWVDTYAELCLRGGESHISPFNNGMRAWHWLNMAEIPNRYWDTPGGQEEHVDVRCSANPADVPGEVYLKWTPPGGIIPPIVGLIETIIPALFGGGGSLLGIRLDADDQDDDSLDG
jgi:hypothetical protein